MHLLEKSRHFPDFSRKLPVWAVVVTRELACLKTAPAF
jgi:hypothetical protein